LSVRVCTNGNDCGRGQKRNAGRDPRFEDRGPRAPVRYSAASSIASRVTRTRFAPRFSPVT